MDLHEHPLFPSARFTRGECSGCHVSGAIYGGYYCNENNCYVKFHKECAEAPLEINNSFHPQHPLTLMFTINHRLRFAPCDLCGKHLGNPVYRCSSCRFKVHFKCGIKPSPLAIEHPLCHDHPLAYLKKRDEESPCELCEENINGPSYSCIQCHVHFHLDCIHLAKEYHGTYSCSVCPNYAAHSRCVVRSGVWDGVELEGIPDDTKYIAPFKVVADDLIVHFSHKDHTLRLHKDNVTQSDRWLQCEACMYPVVFDSIYVCDECGYVLHEKCANLPMKKRLIFDTVPYTLEAHTLDYIDCHMCRTLSDGFLYKSQSQKWNYKDVHCGSLSEPLYHDGHLHPLYFHETRSHHCHGCHDVVHGYVLRCDACNFVLCSYCASLPEKICHMNEENPLTLYYDEKGNNKNCSETKVYLTIHDDREKGLSWMMPLDQSA
ncbi:hypothetical protein Bca101_011461 [Brassica carinata]